MPGKSITAQSEGLSVVEPTYAGDTRIGGMRSWQRQRGYLKSLVEYFGHRLIRAITYEDLVNYRKLRFDKPARHGGRRSVSQVNRELSLLRSIFNYARRSNMITVSPFERGEGLISLADEVQRDRILTPEEEQRLLAACVGRRWHLGAIVIVAIDTGLRKGELLQLRWLDVDLVAGVVTVRKTTTKTRRARLIGITARMKEGLQNLRELAEREAGRSFSEEAFVFGGIKDVKHSFDTACELAGIDDLHFHDLRHTATNRMIQAGLPPGETMKITGHTRFETFARYVNTDQQTAQRAAALLDRLKRPKNRRCVECQ